jgi:hypothetical protein
MPDSNPPLQAAKITGRDEEFTRTITFFYRQELGRDPEPGGLAAWLEQCRNGLTGPQLEKALHDSAEAVAFRARPKVPETPRVHVEGLRFVTEGGAPWVMAFATSFRAYERFLRGEDLQPHLQELAELGANGIRVFGAFDYGSPQTQRLYPREHPDYYDRLAEFFALLQGFGLYAQFCVFADTARSVPGKPAQLAHWTRMVDVLRPIPNVLLERVNENDQHDNRVDADVPRPAGMCASFGSNGGGQDPPGPYWDYSDLHSERRGDFALSTTTVNFAIKGYKGENAAKSFAGTQRATVVSEPPGIADTLVAGRRTNDPGICYQMGVGSSTWGAGGTAHSDCGVQSVVLTPVQKECVRQFINGVKVK